MVVNILRKNRSNNCIPLRGFNRKQSEIEEIVLRQSEQIGETDEELRQYVEKQQQKERYGSEMIYQ